MTGTDTALGTLRKRIYYCVSNYEYIISSAKYNISNNKNKWVFSTDWNCQTQFKILSCIVCFVKRGA